MATKLDKELGATRGEVFFIHNLDAIILPPEERSGRLFPVEDVEIEKLANSIQKIGQEQPIKVRKLADDKVELVVGRNRFKAIKLLRERGDDRPIRAEVFCGSEEEAFLRTIEENFRRSKPSAADDAFNQRRMREVMGWTDKQIAEHYEISVSKVSQLSKLLNLPKHVLKLVHVGDLPVSGALDLLVYADDPEQLDAAIQLATNHDVASALEVETTGLQEAEVASVADNTTKKPSSKKKRVSGAVIKQLTRSEKAKKGLAASRSTREIREFFEAILGGPAWDPAVKTFAKKAREFCLGNVTEKTLENALDALLDAKRSK